MTSSQGNPSTEFENVFFLNISNVNGIYQYSGVSNFSLAIRNCTFSNVIAKKNLFFLHNWGNVTFEDTQFLHSKMHMEFKGGQILFRRTSISNCLQKGGSSFLNFLAGTNAVMDHFEVSGYCCLNLRLREICALFIQFRIFFYCHHHPHHHQHYHHHLSLFSLFKRSPTLAPQELSSKRLRI
jgi:hypothetical protein